MSAVAHALVGGTMVAASLVGIASPASAGPARPTECDQVGAEETVIRSSYSTESLTGEPKGYNVTGGATRMIRYTVTVEREVGTGVKVNGGFSGSAEAMTRGVLGKLKSHLGFAIDRSKRETQTLEVTDEYVFKAKKSTRFVVYQGERRLYGTWSHHKCNREFKVVKLGEGQWETFIPLEGAVKCTDRLKRNNAERLAADRLC